MYSHLPYFVFGFHGCDAATKEAVLRGEAELAPSTNDYDWLGSGIYFWEQNAQRALEFAELSCANPGVYTKRPIVKPAVIGAVIDLGNCMNLMDSLHIHALKSAYDQLAAATKAGKRKMPANRGIGNDRPLRELDRAVIEMLHSLMAQTAGVRPYDTVRGLFLEGDAAYPGGGFREQTHIQICVRNLNCIKGYFEPRTMLKAPYLV